MKKEVPEAISRHLFLCPAEAALFFLNKPKSVFEIKSASAQLGLPLRIKHNSSSPKGLFFHSLHPFKTFKLNTRPGERISTLITFEQGLLPTFNL